MAAEDNKFITPSVIARTGLAHLYNSIVLAGLVWRDFDSDFDGKVGDTVTVRKPAVFEAEVFDRKEGIELQDAEEDSIPVKLDTIANVSFAVTDEQMTLEIEDFSAQLLAPAMEAIAHKVDTDLANALVGAAESEGQLASIGKLEAFTVMRDARTILSRNNLPSQGRLAVLSPEAIASLLGDDHLVTANMSGSTDALRDAQIGKLFGIDTYESQTFGEGPGDKGSADGVSFHRTAVTLASRPLPHPRGLAANQADVASFRGLSLRATYDYNQKYKQDEVSIDMLYGVAETRPEGAIELDFGQGS